MSQEHHSNSDGVDAGILNPSGGFGSRPGTDRVAALVERWLDGVIEPVEIAEMEAAIRESSEARRVFWRRAGFHGLLHEAARMSFASVPDTLAAVGTAIRSGGDVDHAAGRGHERQRWWPMDRVQGWRRADIAVACCLLVAMGGGIGSLVTSLAAASAGRPGADGNGPIVVVAEGFESPPAPSENYLPRTLDCWGGDETCVVGDEAWSSSGILPHSGKSMLQFVSGHPRGVEYPGVASEMWRFVDLDELRALAGSKDIRVELSAWFNSVEPEQGRRPLCGLRAVATHLGPGEVKDTMWINSGLLNDMDAASHGAPPMAASKTEDRLDADPASWQRLTVVLTLPPGSPRFLLLHCYALDRSEAAAAATNSLPGQYVDDISLTVEPADVSRANRTVAVEAIRGPR